MAYVELGADQVDADSPLNETLFEQIRDNQIYFRAFKFETDGSLPMTDDFYTGNNAIRQLDKIYLSNGTVFPDDYALVEGQNMIGASFLGGNTTSGSGSGVINDTNQDFTAEVNTTHLVNIPMIYNEMMFQIKTVAETALTLKLSNQLDWSSGAIGTAFTYTVQATLNNIEWRQIYKATAGADITAQPIDTDSRFLKLEMSDGSNDAVTLTYGDMSVLTIMTAANNGYAYVRVKNGSNNITLSPSGATAEVTIYESVDVVNTAIT